MSIMSLEEASKKEVQQQTREVGIARTLKSFRI